MAQERGQAMATGATGATPAAATLGHRTEVGLVRSHNEDNYALRDDLGLWVVADGMGGAAAGEKASAIAVKTLAAAVQQGAGLDEAIAAANRAILAAARAGEGRAGMGTTVVAARVTESDYQIAWVGDSRAYLWSDGLRRLSHDHSQVQELIDAEFVTEEQARHHPLRSVITRALGGHDGGAAAPQLVSGTLKPGESLLLCSDGLTCEIEDKAIAAILAAELPGLTDSLSDGQAARAGQRAVDRLVDEALAQGGSDNITVVLIGRG
ncbi:MAG: protein phosphatase 2C domain-containing protein [Kiloniellales bacterium]|nr:protein phosphatase 2C domain-containing protein [Kiloniellales bacterium]